MAKNYVHAGEVLQVTVGADTNSGEPVVVGDRVGIAKTNMLAGETGSVEFCGVWRLPKVASGAIAQGKKVYLTPGGSITATASGNTYAGWAAEAVADGEAQICVLLGG